MRKNNSFLKKRYFMIALFLVLIAGVSIGYAALQTTLTINGTTKIKKTSFCVEFQNAVQQDTDFTANPHSINPASTEGDKGITIDSGTCPTHAEWIVTLKEPGDYYSFNIDVKNTGTLNAILESVEATSLTDLTAEQQKYIRYTITPVTQTALPKANDRLNSGNSFTLNFKVEFRTDIDAEDLPREPQEMKFDYKLNYKQA